MSTQPATQTISVSSGMTPDQIQQVRLDVTAQLSKAESEYTYRKGHASEYTPESWAKYSDEAQNYIKSARDFLDVGSVAVLRASYGLDTPTQVSAPAPVPLTPAQQAKVMESDFTAQAAAQHQYLVSPAGQRDLELASQEAKWSVTINGVTKLYDTYMAAEAAVKAANTRPDTRVTSFAPVNAQGVFVDAPGMEAYVAGLNIPITGSGIKSPGFVDAKIAEASASIHSFGRDIEVAAATAKLGGQDVAAGAMASAAIATGVASSVFDAYTWLLNISPTSGVDILDFSDSPLFKTGYVSGYLAMTAIGLSDIAADIYKKQQTASRLKFAATLEDVDFMPTEPYKVYKGAFQEGEYVTNIMVKSPRISEFALETHQPGWETMDFLDYTKQLDEKAVTSFTQTKTVYGPINSERGLFDIFSRPDFIMDDVTISDIVKYRGLIINEADLPAGYTSISSGVPAYSKDIFLNLQDPDVYGRYLGGELNEATIKYMLDNFGEVITSKRVIDAEIPWLEAEKPYLDRLAGMEAAKELSGAVVAPIPGGGSGGGIITVLESVITEAKTYPIFSRGQLPSPYYATSEMVTSGVVTTQVTSPLVLLSLLSTGATADIYEAPVLTKLSNPPIEDMIQKINVDLVTITATLPLIKTPQLEATLAASELRGATLLEVRNELRMPVDEVSALREVTITVADLKQDVPLITIMDIEPITPEPPRPPRPSEAKPPEKPGEPKLKLPEKKERREEAEERGARAGRFRVVLDGRVSTVTASSFVEALSRVSGGRGRRATVTRLS